MTDCPSLIRRYLNGSASIDFDPNVQVTTFQHAGQSVKPQYSLSPLARALKVYMVRRHFGICLLAGLLGCLSPGFALAQELPELQKLVDEARLTFEHFVRNPSNPWLRDNVKHAKGLLIMPSLGEAGYIIGGSLGNGVLLLRDEQTGAWSEPAFFRMVGGTFGLQLGASKSQVLALVMTEKGVKSLLGSTFLLGAGATVAAGPLGSGISGAVSPRMATDFLTFAKSQGAMVNVSLGGTIVAVRNDAHEVYYGEPVDLSDILIGRKVQNWYSARIRKAVSVAAGEKKTTE